MSKVGGGLFRVTTRLRRSWAFPLCSRVLKAWLTVLLMSSPVRMAWSLAILVMTRTAESVKPPRLSTAIGSNRIPLALQAAPTCPTFLAWARLAAYPGCSAPRAMASSRRDAVTQTSSARSSPPDPKGMSRSAGRLTNAMARKSTDGEVDCHLKEQLKACWKYKLELTTGWVTFLGVLNLPNIINRLPHLGHDIIIDQIIDSQFLFLLFQKCKKEVIYRLALCLSK